MTVTKARPGVGDEYSAWACGRAQRALATLRRLNEGRQVHQVLRTEDEVQPGEAPQQPLALLLRDATSDPDDAVRTLGLLFQEAAELGVELVFGLLANRAGVDNDDVRGVGFHSRLVARVVQQVRHLLRVVLVHLAPEGANVELPSHFGAQLSEPSYRAKRGANCALWIKRKLELFQIVEFSSSSDTKAARWHVSGLRKKV